MTLGIGRQIIFDQAELSIHEGEKVALVGRNGCGKTTLLKTIVGTNELSSGKISVTRGVRISELPQDFELPGNATVAECLKLGAAYIESLLAEYEADSATPARHAELEHLITLHDGWSMEAKARELSERLHLPDADRRTAELSGGEKRRVALAAALMAAPDLLLLDEPTNHLDIETIAWIEDMLIAFKGACLFVTHDRYFLDRIATRVVELCNGKFFSSPGSYADFLAAKAEREYSEDQAEAKRNKFLRLEVDWVRRSPKARLRRNLGRLRRFNELSAVGSVKRTGEIELVIPPGGYLGNKVVDVENLSCEIGGRQLFHDFSFEFTPGCKVGVIGPNGAGKTTLINQIIGKNPPQHGSVKIAETVKFNYIDQSRVVLDENKTVAEEIGEGSDSVFLGGERLSIWGYLKRFLFEDERINTQIKYLSGGEKSRLALAKILKAGGNFLVLDEPTNDLDLSSLRLLEESLAEYDGCVIVVSHDRYFLNRVCDTIIALDGRGGIISIAGDYDNYLAKRPQPETEPEKPAEKKKPEPEKPAPAKPGKLTFKQKRRLDELESAIPDKEARIKEIENIFSSPDFYTKFGDRSAELQDELAGLKTGLDADYLEWLELSGQ
ncbi:MAG: ABC-F family ATP-binding cassette domain-containing protein [Victivallaceae bacterium]|nr:ABC-F family ATP-binding cassette domain-containing protein [Victivallaceae bacterium]